MSRAKGNRKQTEEDISKRENKKDILSDIKKEGMEGLRKKHFKAYVLLIFLTYLFTAGIGIWGGFVFTDNYLEFKRSGLIHKNIFSGNQITTFEYIGFEEITWTYPLNGTYEEEFLIVKNWYDSVIHAKTEVEHKTVHRGISIKCKVKDSNQTCDRYTIGESGRTTVLQLEITTGTARKEEYENVCFVTSEINNEKNYIKECIPIIHITKY